MARVELEMHEETGRELQASAPTLLGMSREEWGWLAMGVGAIGILGALLHRDRSPVEWLAPLGLMGGGLAVLLRERAKGIDRVEERIAAELDSLDPLARAQVMKRVASSQLKRLSRDEATES